MVALFDTTPVARALESTRVDEYTIIRGEMIGP